MKQIFTLLAALLLFTPSHLSHAADSAKKLDAQLAAVQAADDARLAAMKAGDRDQLAAIFSDDLHYAHSSGEVDTKASFIDKLTSGKTKYQLMEYEKREFTSTAPGIALMTGRIHIRAAAANGLNDSVLSFLAVWKLEKGHWHFLAWQSCKMPAK